MATTSTNPTTLTPLSPTTTTSITDTLYRAVLGLDTNDLPLWQSAFTRHTLPSFTVFNTTHTSQAALDANVFYKVNNLDTTHFISNVRVSGLPDSTSTTSNGKNGEVSRAKLTAAAQAFHYRPGEGKDTGKTERVVSGSLYEWEVVREEDGEWRIERWDMKVVWLEGEMGVMDSN